MKSTIFRFFCIIVIFLNHIHNSIDPFKQVDLGSNNQTFVLIDKSEIKKELSLKLVSNDSYANILDRECKITGDFHDRHKVRWVKALFLKTPHIYHLPNGG